MKPTAVPNQATHSASISALPPAERDHETVALLRSARRSDETTARRCRRDAIRLNMGLARSLARRYRGQGVSLDDLTQVAYLGLVESTDRFDPELGHSFTDFAVPTIRGELRKHFRDAGWTIRPPRRIQELKAAIRGAEGDLCQQLHRLPNAKELAAYLDESVADVREAQDLDGCYRPTSLDAPAGWSEHASPLSETLAASDGYAPAEARVMLADAVQRLSARDRQIIQLRFFKGLTQREVGDRIGVTQMQVSRLLARIMRDLRCTIEGRSPEDSERTAS